MRQAIFVLLFVVFTIPSFAADDEFRNAVDAAVKDFVAALESKDVAKLSSLYATDAIAYPPNAEMVQGREAIGALWKTLMDANLKGELETIETQSDGNFGFETGKFKILSADGKQVDHGKYVVVYKKENGAWKLYRDIWNSSIPAQPAK